MMYLVIMGQFRINDTDPNNGQIPSDRFSFVPHTLSHITGITYRVDAQNDTIEVFVLGEGTWTYDDNTGLVTFVGISNLVGAPSTIGYKVYDEALLSSNIVNIFFSSALPVELYEFKAILSAPNEVQLSWKVDKEEDLLAYIIERSTDGNTFGYIDAIVADNSSEYKYIDQLKRYAGNLYYRLKMKDLDGTFKYSEVRKVYINNTIIDPILYPNPVVNVLNIKQLSAHKIEIYNINGQLRDVYNVEGLNELQIDLSEYISGTYQLRIIRADQSYKMYKVIKE